MNRTNTAAVDRINRIAQTGDINVASTRPALENLLSFYPDVATSAGKLAAHQVQPQENSGFWNGLKNFAQTNGGRMLLGGLGTAAAVGLTGGDFQDALGYGVIGAGETAGELYRRDQNAKLWQDRADERQARERENQLNRDQRWDMLNATLEAQKQARKENFENQKDILGLSNEFQLVSPILQQQIYDNYLSDSPYLSESEKDYARRNNLGFDQAGFYENVLLNPNSSNEDFNNAMNYMGRRVQLQRILNNKPLTLGDAAKAAESLHKAGITPEGLSTIMANNGFNGLSFVDVNQKPNEKLILFDALLKRGFSENDARVMAGLENTADKLGLYSAQRDIDSSMHSKNAQTDYKYNQMLEGDKANTQAYLKGIDAQYAEDKAVRDYGRERDFEAYKRTLPAEEVVKAAQRAQILKNSGYDVGLDDLIYQDYQKNALALRQDQANIDKASADLAKSQAETRKIERELSVPYQTEAEKAAEKKKAVLEVEAAKEKEDAARQKEIMLPRIQQAVSRAEEALNDGTGLGQFGGWGWTNDQGGKNRAAIQTVQAQINTMMRGLLKDMGVGSTELNSAAEAAAYRYSITPNMPVEQIRATINQFMEDYLSGALEADVSAIAGQYRPDYTNLSDEELLKGL